MSTASFYKWRAKYGGMDASMISQLKALAEENRRLKKMYAEMSMQAELLKEALGKKCCGHPLADRQMLAFAERLNAARWPGTRWRCAG